MIWLAAPGALEAKDLEVARQWAREVKPHRYPWYIGYGGLPLAECYLRTGDPKILENIQAGVENAVATQYLGGWLGRGGVTPSYGNGHLNAAGTHVLTFLLLALPNIIAAVRSLRPPVNPLASSSTGASTAAAAYHACGG